MNIRKKTCKIFCKQSRWGGGRMHKCAKTGDLRMARGITLIALIVTLIVLLILAGVSLNLVAGSDGIISKASNAVSETKKATIKEEVELLIAELQMDYYADYANNKANYSTALDYAKAELQTGTKKTGSGVTIKYTAPKYYYERTEFTIDTNGNVTVGENTGNAGGATTPTPSATATEAPSPTVTPEQKYTVTYNANGGETTPESATNLAYGSSVTLPTSARTGYVFLGWADDQNAETEDYTDTYTVTGNATLYAVWSPIQSYHAQHPELHIPTGFRYLTGSWDEGYVITDSPEDSTDLGNEFVWIPVANEEAYTKKLGANNWCVSAGTTGEDLATTLGDDVTKAVQGDRLLTPGETASTVLGTTFTDDIVATSPEKAIVSKAGGFWVGRYEAGVENTQRTEYIAGIQEWSNTESEASNTYWTGKTIVVKPGAEPARVITQIKALEIANSWKSGNAGSGTVAFKSGLITGSQWDAMCNFIGWDTCNSDCSAWGNYGNATGASYTGYCSSDAKTDWRYVTTLEKSGDWDNTKNTWTERFIFQTGKFINTKSGTATPTVKNNIYDVAGNVWEWTTEVPQNNLEHAMYRGGGVGDDGCYYLATSRAGDRSVTTNAAWHIGFRIVLYVQ